MGKESEVGKENTYVRTWSVVPVEVLKVLPRLPEGQRYYEEMARLPVRVLEEAQGSTRTIWCACSPLTGEQLAVLRLAAAPSKRYYTGLDFYDTVGDWNDLFLNESGRLQRHRNLPAWEVFERDWKKVLEFMQRGMERYTKGEFPNETAERWTFLMKFTGGDSEGWKWDNQTSNPPSGLLARGEVVRCPWLFTTFLAAFAPEITSTWGTSRNYEGEHGQGQDMGPTQAIVLALGLRNSLLHSDLIKNILNDSV